MNLWHQWVGWWRLRGPWGNWCPVCRSSPPDPDCYVCKGSYEYGPSMPKALNDQWWDRFFRDDPKIHECVPYCDDLIAQTSRCQTCHRDMTGEP